MAMISRYSGCRSFLASACFAIGLILVSPFGYAGSMDDDPVLDDKSVLSAVSLRDQSREAPRKRIDHARLDIDRAD